MTTTERSPSATDSFTSHEMMIVAAARELPDGAVCFVGIGLPSTAANLARTLHAPRLALVYESGCLGSKPETLPLSIGDGSLAETADAVVSVPEVFNYWLQAGRIDVGFLGGAQIDRFGNINTTFVGGTYDDPAVRLPGAGGAPEIAASCRKILVIMKQSTRAFVESVQFRTSMGFGDGRGDRDRLGIAGGGPSAIFTDIGVMEPDPVTGEFTLTSLHPGRTVEEARAATGWDLKVAEPLGRTTAPSAQELDALRRLESGRRAHDPAPGTGDHDLTLRGGGDGVGA
jgi:glutaconate CoA-transferase subunit B